jgi:hypothetical protein
MDDAATAELPARSSLAAGRAGQLLLCADSRSRLDHGAANRIAASTISITAAWSGVAGASAAQGYWIGGAYGQAAHTTSAPPPTNCRKGSWKAP